MTKQFHTHPVHLPRVRDELTERMASDSEHICQIKFRKRTPHPSIQASFQTACISECKTTTKCWFACVPGTPYIKLHISISEGQSSSFVHVNTTSKTAWHAVKIVSKFGGPKTDPPLSHRHWPATSSAIHTAIQYAFTCSNVSVYLSI